MRLFSLTLCILFFVQRGFADDVPPSKKPVQNFLVECQMVVLPEKVALPLLSDLLEEAKIDAAFADVQKMIADGRAQLAANLISRMSDELKTVTETGEEMRYGVQFDPPQLPTNAPQDAKVLKDWPLIGITPTTFETRNVGAKFEVSVVPEGDGHSFLVSALCEHVRFLRWSKTDAGKLATGDVLFIEQPVFHVSKSVGDIHLRSGQRTLLGVHKVPGTADSLELFFLRVSAAPIKAP